MNSTATHTGPPEIAHISFPNILTGDKSRVKGTLDFRDPDSDVNRLVVQVLEATNFGGADDDPGPYLYTGNKTEGTYLIYIWCDGEQYVILRYTLYDRAGNKSNSMQLSFKCTK